VCAVTIFSRECSQLFCHVFLLAVYSAIWNQSPRSRLTGKPESGRRGVQVCVDLPESAQNGREVLGKRAEVR